MIAPCASRRVTGIFCALLALVVHLQTSGAAFAAGEEPGRPLVFGFLPIVSPEKLVRRFDGPLMKAVIVARRDGEIATPEDLCGRRNSTPDALVLVALSATEKGLALLEHPG